MTFQGSSIREMDGHIAPARPLAPGLPTLAPATLALLGEASSAAAARHWIGVASAEHVARGREGGFMQVCHGKSGPLRRIRPGDGMVYYSPTAIFGGKDRLQAFTAIGKIAAGEPYRVDMGDGFQPWRRDVSWDEAGTTAIQPLLPLLDLTRHKANWGYQFRFGIVEIGGEDFRLIADAMGAGQ